MAKGPTVSNDSVVVLFKGGRLPAWHRVAPEDQRAYERTHVDLMLDVARRRALMGVEGYKLLGPQQSWEKFWVIEFPTIEGAEEWIEAEMAPPYGTYGSYEYYVARRWGAYHFSQWVTRPRAPRRLSEDADPAKTPPLDVDRSSVVVLLFGMGLPEYDYTPAEERGDTQHIELMKSIAREHGLMCLEAFKLVSPQPDWHRAWVIEFPTLEGAEAWMDGEVAPPYGSYRRKSMVLARRWAPDHFATWATR